MFGATDYQLMDALEVILEKIADYGDLPVRHSVVGFVRTMTPQERGYMRMLLPKSWASEPITETMEFFCGIPAHMVTYRLLLAMSYAEGSIMLDLTQGEEEMRYIPFSQN